MSTIKMAFPRIGQSNMQRAIKISYKIIFIDII